MAQQQALDTPEAQEHQDKVTLVGLVSMCLARGLAEGVVAAQALLA